MYFMFYSWLLIHMWSFPLVHLLLHFYQQIQTYCETLGYRMPVELRCLSDGAVMCILLFFSKGGGSMSVLWSSSEIPWFLF